MTACHQSCLTCSASTFNSCLTCSAGLTLSYGTCNCDSVWQTQCTGQSMLRPAVLSIDMLVKLYIVGVMLLYILRVKLPLSYRVWSALNGLSLLVYNQIFYLQYEDELCLKALSVSNGPYFASFRVMQLSTSHIFPTMSLIIIMIVLFILLYFPLAAFNKPQQSIIEYVKTEGLHILDCSYFFASKMMFFYIGKFVKQSGSGVSILYIVVVGVYGLLILLSWVRNIYKYHQGTTQNHIYPTPIYLYTILTPASIIGLPLATSEIILVIVYCSPLALLILILLLNRNMEIFNKPNIKFFIVQIVMIGLTIAFIFVGDPIRTYILLGIIGLSIITITVQTWILYVNGFDLGISKVYPILEHEQPEPKKIYGEQNNQKNSKYGYF